MSISITTPPASPCSSQRLLTFVAGKALKTKATAKYCKTKCLVILSLTKTWGFSQLFEKYLDIHGLPEEALIALISNVQGYIIASKNDPEWKTHVRKLQEGMDKHKATQAVYDKWKSPSPNSFKDRLERRGIVYKTEISPTDPNTELITIQLAEYKMSDPADLMSTCSDDSDSDAAIFIPGDEDTSFLEGCDEEEMSIMEIESPGNILSDIDYDKENAHAAHQLSAESEDCFGLVTVAEPKNRKFETKACPNVLATSGRRYNLRARKRALEETSEAEGKASPRKRSEKRGKRKKRGRR